ncbi:MAG TPA: hypothetical protein VFW33_19900, partial [Gemmataceae bacterium]|nr:hypothetical protein [Gemmataceae bacterium]
VFKYTLSGSPQGSWVIDPANASPTGLTINPNNVSDIWVVDSGTKKVYQYTAAAGLTSGSRSAAASFALASGNTNPQDIADPPPPDMPLTPAAASLAPSQPSPAVIGAESAVGPAAVVGRDAVFALMVREPLATPGGVPSQRRTGPATDPGGTPRPVGASGGEEALDFRRSVTSGGSHSLRPERSAVDPPDGTLVDEHGPAPEGPFSDGPANDAG